MVNNDWDYRFKVTSDNTKVAASIKGLAIDLSNAPSEFWSNVKSDGSDIRVTDSSNNLVARDVVSIDTSGQTGLLRVDTSDISTSADSDYYVYYGNASADEPAAGSTYGQYNAYESDVVVYYPFEEGSGSTASDRTSNENEGTLINSPDWIEGTLGNALKFDGSTNYVSAPHESELSLTNTNQSLSISAILRFDALNNEWYMVSKYNFNSSIRSGWGLYFSPSFLGGSIGMIIARNGSNRRFVHADFNPSTDTDYHVIATYNGGFDTSSFAFYINGVQYSSSSRLSDGSSGSISESHNFMVGSEDDGTRYYLGSADEVFVHKGVITFNEATTSYNNESDNDSFWTFGAQEEVGSGFISSTAILDGSPVEGATVRLINQSTNSYIGETETNTNGEYTFENLVEDDFYHVSGEYKDASDDTFRSFSYPYVKPEVNEE